VRKKVTNEAKLTLHPVPRHARAHRPIIIVIFVYREEAFSRDTVDGVAGNLVFRGEQKHPRRVEPAQERHPFWGRSMNLGPSRDGIAVRAQ